MDRVHHYSNNLKRKCHKLLMGRNALEGLGVWSEEQHGEMEALSAGDMVSMGLHLTAADGKATAALAERLKAWGAQDAVH